MTIPKRTSPPDASSKPTITVGNCQEVSQSLNEVPPLDMVRPMTPVNTHRTGAVNEGFIQASMSVPIQNVPSSFPNQSGSLRVQIFSNVEEAKLPHMNLPNTRSLSIGETRFNVSRIHDQNRYLDIQPSQPSTADSSRSSSDDENILRNIPYFIALRVKKICCQGNLTKFFKPYTGKSRTYLALEEFLNMNVEYGREVLMLIQSFLNNAVQLEAWFSEGGFREETKKAFREKLEHIKANFQDISSNESFIRLNVRNEAARAKKQSQAQTIISNISSIETRVAEESVYDYDQWQSDPTLSEMIHGVQAQMENEGLNYNENMDPETFDELDLRDAYTEIAETELELAKSKKELAQLNRSQRRLKRVQKE